MTRGRRRYLIPIIVEVDIVEDQDHEFAVAQEVAKAAFIAAQKACGPLRSATLHAIVDEETDVLGALESGEIEDQVQIIRDRTY